MKTGIIIWMLLVSMTCVYSQKIDCKVNIPEISAQYDGDCRKGFAHGKGIAQGIDKYEGSFRNGFPHGKGTYTWSDGKYYEGEWKNGKKNGEGKMVENGSVVAGIWEDDIYIGEKRIPPYEVTRNVNITRTSFIKSDGAYEEIRIKLMRGGVENTGIVDIYISQSSGEEFRDGSVYGIMNPKFPVDVKIRFKAMSAFGTARFDVFFDFRINEPGTWVVRLSY